MSAVALEVCPVGGCARAFGSVKGVRHHLSQYHSRPQKERYRPCPDCGRRIAGNGPFSQHRRAHKRPIQHGTHSGYQCHRVRREEPCEPCRVAHRLYQRAYQRRNASRLHRLRKPYNVARRKALTRLGRLHPEQYQALLFEELRKIRVA